MNIIKTVINILSKITTIIVIVYAITIVPVIFNYHPLVVLSGSMEPTYHVGSLIYYQEKENYELGEAITFKYNNDLVTHRIVKVEDNNVITQGDSNSSPDLEPVSKSNIKGKVMLTIPYIGYYLKFINDNQYLVIIMLTIISIDILINSKKRVDNNV